MDYAMLLMIEMKNLKVVFTADIRSKIFNRFIEDSFNISFKLNKDVKRIRFMLHRIKPNNTRKIIKDNIICISM